MAIKICLDAGHDGKYNHSSVVPAYYESDFNWKLYTKLKKCLEEYGIAVIGTRENQNVEMGTISRGKKSSGCDLFISLHANAAERETADYVLVIEMLTKKKHDLAVKFAKAIKEVMGTKENYEVITKKKDDGGEWYGVLQGCDAVGNDSGFIIEHSFYTNKAMATWMMKDENITKLAQLEADIIADYFNVKKPITPTPTVQTYTVVTTINRYNSETNAKAKKNSIGTYAPGTYYIYNKYPNGSQGMLNISKDKTGNTAGSWINPAENVIPKVVEEPKQEEIKKEEVKVEEPEKVTPEDVVVDTPTITEPEVLPEATPDDTTNTDIVVEVPKDEVTEPEIEVKDEETTEPTVEAEEEDNNTPTIGDKNATLLNKILGLLIELLGKLLSKLLGKNK